MKKLFLFAFALLWTVSILAENRTVKLDTLTVNYVAKEGDVLKGTLQNNVYISIFTGAHITLENVTINGVDNSAYDWPGISCRGDATITLVGTNNIKGFRAIHPGIEVRGGSTLTIEGNGTLYASSNGRAAGIGAGWCGIIGNSFYEQDCGSIIIKGGTIYSVGGMDAAGIGGSKGSYVDDITITSGVTKVVATGGNGSPHAIGKGVNGHGVMTVNVGGKIYTDGGTAEGTVTYIPWTGNLADLQDDSEVKDGSTISGTLRGSEKPYKITIPDGAHIKLGNANINTEGSTRIVDNDHPWAGLTCNGDATIELTGTTKLSSFSPMHPGIYVPEGKTLTIKGSGSLVALSGTQGAGIGGATYLNCGNIRIEGGDVEAVGGSYAASIGVGNRAHCGTITITNGVTRVKATKGANTPYSVGAGGSSSSCGTIKVGSTTYTTGITDNPFIYPTQTPQTGCVTPTNLQVVEKTASTAVVTWTPGSSTQNKWQVVYYKNFGAAGGWKYKTATTNSYTITDLQPDTEYAVRIKALCSDDNSSPMSDEVIFTTPSVQGIDEILDKKDADHRKFIIDGHLVIKVGDKLYDAQGKELK